MNNRLVNVSVSLRKRVLNSAPVSFTYCMSYELIPAFIHLFIYFEWVNGSIQIVLLFFQKEIPSVIIVSNRKIIICHLNVNNIVLLMSPDCLHEAREQHVVMSEIITTINLWPISRPVTHIVTHHVLSAANISSPPSKTWLTETEGDVCSRRTTVKSKRRVETLWSSS